MQQIYVAIVVFLATPALVLAQGLQNPLQSNSISGFVSDVLQAILLVGFPVAALFVVYAGFKYIAAQGKPDALKEANKNLVFVLIGLAIFLGAWALAEILQSTVNEVTGTDINIIR